MVQTEKKIRAMLEHNNSEKCRFEKKRKIFPHAMHAQSLDWNPSVCEKPERKYRTIAHFSIYF